MYIIIHQRRHTQTLEKTSMQKETSDVMLLGGYGVKHGEFQHKRNGANYGLNVSGYGLTITKIAVFLDSLLQAKMETVYSYLQVDGRVVQTIKIQ